MQVKWLLEHSVEDAQMCFQAQAAQRRDIALYGYSGLRTWLFLCGILTDIDKVANVFSVSLGWA